MGKLLTKKEENAIRLAKELAVPCADDGIRFTDTTRIEVVNTELKDTPYRCIVDNPIFKLYGIKELGELPSNLLIVSTHIDCLQYKPVFEDYGKIIHGIFDNAITNAAVISLMQTEKLNEKIVFAFTGNEEDGMAGVDELIKVLRSYNKEFRAIVLDVSEEGYEDKAAFTIENGFWMKSEGSWWYENIFSKAKLSGNKWRYVSACNEDERKYIPEDVVMRGLHKGIVVMEDGEYAEAEPDESWEYDEHNIACFSLCLPMKGDMHEQKGFDIRKESYLSYIQMLSSL